MGKLKLALLTVLLFTVHSVWAQRKVTGRVTDRDGTALPGVTVSVKNTKNATVTANDGTYSISAQANNTLVFSSVGYQNIELSASSDNVNATLTIGTNSLSEVVVVGYGSRSKRDLTGSISKISAREVNNTPATSFETAIQGRAAGVLVEQQNGKLGQGINIRIRGASSVSAGNEPLYVVDGIPVITDNLSNNGAATNPLADLNMNDIESIDILKDASSAAIYGSRASNGVVLITTKKGRSGTSKVEFGYYTGLQYPSGHRKFFNAQDYVAIEEAAGVGAAKQDFAAGFFATLQDALDFYKARVDNRLKRYSAGNNDWQTGKVNTNWEDQAFQRAPISQYDINFNGGTDKTKYYVSGQYLDQNGIIVKNKFKRYNGRINLDQQVKNWLNIGANMSFARSENYRPSNDDQFSTPLQIVALSPITPLIDPRTGLPSGALDPVSGQPNTNYPVYYNPLLSVYNAYYNTFVNRTIGNVYGNVNILNGLTFRSELGMDQLNQTEEAYRGKLTARVEGVPNGYGYYITTQVLNINTNNYFHYINNIGEKTNLDVTAGMSYEKGSITSSQATAQDFPSDSYKKLSSGAKKLEATTASTEHTLLSYFLRANVKFNEKLLLALSGRADASSRFGVNNRWGFFPAVSAGYVLSKEALFENISWLNFLKVKASYGLTGNQNIPDFAARGLFSGDAAYGGLAGQHPTQLENPDLKWESTRGADLGFEASIFKNRISIEFDVYQRLTNDLLLNQEVPGTSGFATKFTNIGKLENKGLELTINTTNVAGKNFRWTTNLNFSLNRNKITDLGGQIIGGDQNKAMEGQPLGVFFAREFAGVDPANGDALFYTNTLKADGSRDRTTTNDYNAASDVVIGDPNPKFIYGFGNTFSYKGIDLDILLQGVYGNKVYNGGGQYMSANASNGYDNQTIDQLSYWKKPGDITMVPEPRLFYANGTDPSSRYISDGSYLRVKSVSLGYNLPASLISKVKLDRVRIYVRALNLFTITKYKGWDPEVNADYQASNVNRSVDFYSAPQIKSIVFGINIGL
ncbi:MAG: SusC/RagA family TonB-linked outer membrane protein [Flavisolibacter sp.]